MDPLTIYANFDYFNRCNKQIIPVLQEGYNLIKFDTVLTRWDTYVLFTNMLIQYKDTILDNLISLKKE